jgi:DNA-binding beta-propeller fold protein YncE
VSLETGVRLGGYVIDDVVGRGGMGVVYRATEIALERPVALKLIAPELANDDGFRERFLRESRLAASLDHPAILPLYAAGEADGQLYIATRFVDGIDLRAMLATNGPLPAERTLSLVHQVADALDAAHARNLVHGDVKPGNVLVDASDHCYLCDFGLTTQIGIGGTTLTGGLKGTLDYLAPEQIRGDDVDGRADQYALGCLLYELLSGRPPFRRETEAQTLWAHMQEDADPLREQPELDAVVARALAKEPDERYESCNAFVEDARAALGLAPSPITVRRRRRRAGRLLLASGAALLAATAVVVALVLTAGDGGVDVRPNSLALVDPRSLDAVAAVPVGNAPTATAASKRWIWVVNSNDGTGTISRIDPRTRRVASTFSVGGTPRSLAAAYGSLWVGTGEGRVVRVEPDTDLILKSWTLPNAGKSSAFLPERGAGWLAVGGDAVWAASAQAISRIDPHTSRLRSRESSVWGPLAYGFGSVWVLGDELERVSPRTLRRIDTVNLANGFVGLVAGSGAVWVANEDNRTVVRVDPAQNVVSRTYDVGGRPSGLALGAGTVWVASDAGIARIDPGTDEVRSLALGGAPRNLTVATSGVWASVD